MTRRAETLLASYLGEQNLVLSATAQIGIKTLGIWVPRGFATNLSFSHLEIGFAQNRYGADRSKQFYVIPGVLVRSTLLQHGVQGAPYGQNPGSVN